MSQPCPHLGLLVSVMPHASSGQGDALRDDLLALLAANDLVGAAAPKGREYAVSREGGQATDADRQLLLAWAERWAHAAAIEVSPVTDLGDDA